MARKTDMTKLVKLTVLISFNGLAKGETAYVTHDHVVRGWESKGLVRTEPYAPGTAGQSSAEPDDSRSITVGAGPEGPTSGEPGEGAVSG